MTDKLLCPFCGEKLVRYWGMGKPALYCCDNPKCSKGGIGTEQSWQALTDTKKKLDIAVDALKSAHDYYEYCIQRDYVGDDINWDCIALNMELDISEALKQINQKEQQ